MSSFSSLQPQIEPKEQFRFFEDNRILSFILTTLTIPLTILCFLYCRPSSPALPKIPLFSFVLPVALLIPSFIFNGIITICFPRFSKLITAYQTPGPVIEPPINTAFVQLRIIFQFIAFLASGAIVGMTNFQLFEIMFESHSTNVIQFHVTRKFIAWFVLLAISSSNAWLVITAGNDDKRSISHYKKFHRTQANLDPNSPSASPHHHLNIDKDILNTFDTPIASTQSPVNNDPTSLPLNNNYDSHFVDHHRQRIPLSPLSFLPHHHHFRPTLEPYSITTHEPKLRTDNRFRAAITHGIFIIFTLILFATATTNVIDEVDGTHSRRAPPSWYILLSLSTLPIFYHLFVINYFPRFSTTFTTHSQIHANQGISNLSGSAVELDQSTIPTLSNLSTSTEYGDLSKPLLVPHRNKHVGIGLILLQLIGTFFKFLLSTSFLFLMGLLIAFKQTAPESDTIPYIKWLILWGIDAIIGLLSTFFSILAIRDEVNSYRAHDRYYTDWLMFVSIPDDPQSQFLAHHLGGEY